MSIPAGARKIAHYWYSDGNELVVFAHKRDYYVRDGKTGEPPIDPCYGDRSESPSELHDDTSYDCLGLYYGYEMKDTGWSGDC